MDKARNARNGGSILPSINKEAQIMFESKTRDELERLEQANLKSGNFLNLFLQDIKAHISRGSIAGAAVDVSYWEDLQSVFF